MKRRGWRKPKGLHSKVRECRKGNVGLFKIGMGKGCNAENVKIIHNIEELKNEKMVIIADIGLKKKKKVIEEAERLGIEIVNIRNPKEFLKKIEERIKGIGGKKEEESIKKKERKINDKEIGGKEEEKLDDKV